MGLPHGWQLGAKVPVRRMLARRSRPPLFGLTGHARGRALLFPAEQLERAAASEADLVQKLEATRQSQASWKTRVIRHVYRHVLNTCVGHVLRTVGTLAEAGRFECRHAYARGPSMLSAAPSSSNVRRPATLT